MAVDLPRETALKILYDINEKGAYSNIALNRRLEENSGLKGIDRAFITDLVYGTVKWKLTLDWNIERFSSVKLRKISPWLLNILRLGVYQLLFTDKVPESAAVNESVKLAGKYGHPGAGGFVNGILRSVARSAAGAGGAHMDAWFPGRSAGAVRYLSVRYSYPEWLVEYWIGLYGEEFTEGLLESGNETPDFTVRVNTLKTSRDELMKALQGEGLRCEKGRYCEEALRIKNPSSVTRLDAFREGLFQVQDESSMLVGRVLDPKPGELVADVCGAPGGKATHIAQLMGNKGTVIARDIHEHKIKLIEESVKRLGADIVKTELYDAAKRDESLVGRADRVVVDAPCSGLGIIRRKPDIKWSRIESDAAEIMKLQGSILNTSASYVKPGGTLVYSTCTIGPGENENIVNAFLSENRDFRLADISPYLPGKLADLSRGRGYIQIFPNRDGIDGFFISRMERG